MSCQFNVQKIIAKMAAMAPICGGAKISPRPGVDHFSMCPGVPSDFTIRGFERVAEGSQVTGDAEFSLKNVICWSL